MVVEISFARIWPYLVQIMKENNCFSILGSWVLLFAGFYFYDIGGFMYGLAPLIGAAILRGDRDKLVKGDMWESRSWQIFMLIYYGALFIVTLSDTSTINRKSMISFVVIIGFPVLLNILIHDLRTCLSKGPLRSD